MLRLRQLAPLGLEPIDLTLGDGACLTVSGPSGSGKTIFLRAIADLDLNGGEAETANLVRSHVEASTWRASVAYVPAESGWWADGVGSHMPEGDPKPLLESVGLDLSCLDWTVSRLSTGERQRLALVRALISNPGVLLLDEPTSALDAESTAQVEQLIKDHQARGATVVLVTHDVEQRLRFSGHHAHIEHGRFEFQDEDVAA
jgi:ABC-type multidrug transport system ATPase subunit